MYNITQDTIVEGYRVTMLLEGLTKFGYKVLIYNRFFNSLNYLLKIFIPIAIRVIGLLLISIEVIQSTKGNT